MICNYCKNEGLRSKVYIGTVSVTTMGWQPYYDEDGNFVSEDPNIMTQEYSCSNKHCWEVKTQYGKMIQ